MLTLLSFSARTRIPLLHLPTFITHHVSTKGKIRIKGLAQNSDAKPLRDARILIIDTHNRVEGQTTTDTHGLFHCLVPDAKDYTIEVLAIGYQPFRTPVTDKSGTITVTLHNTAHITIQEVIVHMATWIMSWCFELFLVRVISISIELLIGFTWGFGRTAPFLFLSLLNAALWMVHITHHKRVL
jgi:hypothetical protein